MYLINCKLFLETQATTHQELPFTFTPTQPWSVYFNVKCILSFLISRCIIQNVLQSAGIKICWNKVYIYHMHAWDTNDLILNMYFNSVMNITVTGDKCNEIISEIKCLLILLIIYFCWALCVFVIFLFLIFIFGFTFPLLIWLVPYLTDGFSRG